MHFDVLRAFGKVPVSIDKLKIEVRGSLISWIILWINLMLIPLISLESLGLILRVKLAKQSWEIGRKNNEFWQGGGKKSAKEIFVVGINCAVLIPMEEKKVLKVKILTTHYEYVFVFYFYKNIRELSLFLVFI